MSEGCPLTFSLPSPSRSSSLHLPACLRCNGEICPVHGVSFCTSALSFVRLDGQWSLSQRLRPSRMLGSAGGKFWRENVDIFKTNRTFMKTSLSYNFALKIP